jgi:uncharacterized linocin/CFP29 family protein
MDYLNRNASPFSADLWSAFDHAAVKAARDMLTGRRFLEVEGPYGVGLNTIEVGHDSFCRQPAPNEAGAVMGHAISVPMLRRSFNLSIRRLAGHLEMNQPLDTTPVEEAAEAVALREEEFVYYGQKDFNLHGLLTSPGRNDIVGGDWNDPDTALENVVAAVTRLDESGFRGPHALVAAPEIYNGLFRRYGESDLPQADHIARLCTRGIYKAPIKGAAVIDPRAGKIIVGQDMMVGYAGSDGIHAQLFASESIVLKLDSPAAVCTITVPESSEKSRTSH